MKPPKHFYYIAHKDNLKSILKNGILSHRRADRWSLKNWISKKTIIYDKGIVDLRKNIHFNKRSLWEYANVYFQARNPMLYRVIKEHEAQNIVILQINSDIINSSNVGIADGNASSQSTTFFEDTDKGLGALNPEQFERSYWSEEDDSKRKIMAEALIYSHIPKEKIIGIYTANQETANQIRKDITGPLNIMPNPNMFFLPEYENVIFPYSGIKKETEKHITLKKGDMFFSKMQTFTVSVNTVGVMGKGLASRAKYQFPDAYVLYQDLCRQKKLKMGVPYLYKREANFIKTLMENVSSSVATENGHRWFLLFPTKNHWREKSPVAGIEKGLNWLVDNYKSQGIESLALPALGCGLGGLDWKELGPLMCKYLKKMDIPSAVYLPLEKQIPEEQLQPEFLFNNL